MDCYWRSKDSPNRGDAQGREETFRVVLPSKACFYGSGALRVDEHSPAGGAAGRDERCR